MLFFLDGLTLIISHSEEITTPGTSVVERARRSRRSSAPGTYSELIWAIGIVIILQVVLSFTRWGLYTVAAGGNRLGAAEAGINVKLVLVRNFVLCALTAGLRRDPRGGADVEHDPGPVRLEHDPVGGGRGGDHRRHADDRRLGHRRRRLDRGAVPRRSSTTVWSSRASAPTTIDLYLGIAIIIAMTVNVYVQRVRRGSGRG